MGFGLILEHFGKRGQLDVLKKTAAKINRLRTEQGKRASCFKKRGDQIVKLISAQGLSPAMPEFARWLHSYEKYSINLKAIPPPLMVE